MHPAIAIDGPAASGKSTVAKLIADRLGYTFINTGAMYRAVTWYMLEQGINPADTTAVLESLPSVPLSFGKDGSRSVVLCGQHVLGEELTSRQVNDHVSTIAAIPEVRALLVERQREYNRREPVVMEGRDIGTVVFPDTPFKYFVTASEEVRAARRAAEGLTDSIAERDRKDSSRATAPLAQAPDALLVDTSDMRSSVSSPTTSNKNSPPDELFLLGFLHALQKHFQSLLLLESRQPGKTHRRRPRAHRQQSPELSGSAHAGHFL